LYTLQCCPLHHNKIEGWEAEPKPTQNSLIEILVNNQPQHRKTTDASGLPYTSPPQAYSFAESYHLWALGMHLPSLLGRLLLSCEIRVYARTML